MRILTESRKRKLLLEPHLRHTTYIVAIVAHANSAAKVLDINIEPVGAAQLMSF